MNEILNKYIYGEMNQFYFGVNLQTYNPSSILFEDVSVNYANVGEVIHITKDNIVDVADVLVGMISTLHYDLLKKLEPLVKNLPTIKSFPINVNDKKYAVDKEMSEDNLSSLIKELETDSVTENETFDETAYLRNNWKYTPICRIILGEINSYEPYKEEEVLSAEKLFEKFNLEVKQQDRLSNTFCIKIKLYDYIAPDGLVDLSGLRLHLCHAIKEQLLDVIDEMKREETYSPNAKVCEIIDTIGSHHELTPTTVKTVLPCRIGELQKLGIEQV